MATALWTPSSAGIRASIWEPGGPLTVIIEESDVLVVNLLSSVDGSFGGTEISNWNLTEVLTASDYASANETVPDEARIVISQAGVYEIGLVAILTPATGLDLVDNSVSFGTKAATSFTAPVTPVLPGERSNHRITSGPQGLDQPYVQFTDNFIMVVTAAELPYEFSPAIIAEAYGLGGAFTGELTVVVRRSGTYLGA